MRARDNPFATERVLRIRYRLAEGSVTSLVDRLAAMNYHGALVGPEGSGKTTLLEDLAGPLEQRGFRTRFLRIRPDACWPDLSAVGERDVVLLDSAEQLGRYAWWRFRHRTRRRAGLVITTHRPGRLPTLLHCGTSPKLLEEIVRQLAETSESDWRPLIEPLFARHGGNIRDALRELYDRYAG